MIPSVQDRLVYHELFLIANVENKSFLIKKEAMSFFLKTGIPRVFLEEIWETADPEQKGYLTELEFYVALKLIACAQNGIDILSPQGNVPVPLFDGITLHSGIAPITANERDAYKGLFHSSCNPVDGLLHGEQAIAIFIKSNLPSQRLADIWTLVNTRNSDALNKTEFIIAMHYISRLMKDPTIALPSTIPSQVYVEATGRFASTDSHNTTVVNRSPATTSSNNAHIVLTSEEKERYQTYFHQLDTDRSGFIDAEEAVHFFSHSQLPNDELGRIWKIADNSASPSIGKLGLHDFCIAMHLIHMRKRGQSIEKYESIQNQTVVVPINMRYELENQLIELKQQMNYEYRRIAEYQRKQTLEQESINRLHVHIMTVKSELDTVERDAKNSEKRLHVEQKKNRELKGISSLDFSYSSAEPKIDSPTNADVPELIRAPSSLSDSSSSISPRPDFTPKLNPFAGLRKMVQETYHQDRVTALSSSQGKAVYKYGCVIAAFDVLSIDDNSKSQEKISSVKDDLASLFGSPAIEFGPENDSTFDSVFL